MKTLRFTEYYLPDKKIEAISDRKRYTRNELYRNIYAFMNLDGFTAAVDYRYKLGSSPVFKVSDMKKVYHDIEMSDEAYDVVHNIIKKNREINLEIQEEIRRYGKVREFSVNKFKRFSSDILPNSQRKIVDESFDFSIGTVKRGSRYLSFIYEVSILVEGEWMSVENNYKYVDIQ